MIHHFYGLKKYISGGKKAYSNVSVQLHHVETGGSSVCGQSLFWVTLMAHFSHVVPLCLSCLVLFLAAGPWPCKIFYGYYQTRFRELADVHPVGVFGPAAQPDPLPGR